MDGQNYKEQAKEREIILKDTDEYRIIRGEIKTEIGLAFLHDISLRIIVRYTCSVIISIATIGLDTEGIGRVGAGLCFTQVFHDRNYISD